MKMLVFEEAEYTGMSLIIRKNSLGVLDIEFTELINLIDCPERLIFFLVFFQLSLLVIKFYLLFA